MSATCRRCTPTVSRPSPICALTGMTGPRSRRLPNVEAALLRVQLLDPRYQAGSVQLYLGILNTLRPEALGGKPELEARALRAGDRAQRRSGSGREGRARAQLRAARVRSGNSTTGVLNEVLQADPVAPGLTLLNVIAQRDARALLDSADDYF